MSSVFTKILRGDIPSYKIAEDDLFYAFLDINPFSLGHTLVIPKQEIDYLFDIDDELYGKLMMFTKKVALAINASLSCHRVGILVQGTEVPHAHIHLIPFYTPNGEEIFGKRKVKLNSDEFVKVQDTISNKFSILFGK
jgi:histidine triad (HIT) family protein